CRSLHRPRLSFRPFPPPPRATLFPYTTLFRSRPPGGTRTRTREPRLAHRRGRDAARALHARQAPVGDRPVGLPQGTRRRWNRGRSEEHTSELQSRENLVCRLLLEKKNNGQAET